MPGMSQMERLLQSFQISTGLDAIVVNQFGETILQPGSSRQCRFCRLVQSMEPGKAKCAKTYARAAMIAHDIGETHVFRCHVGLVCLAVPITVGQRSAALVCNQVLMWEPDEVFAAEMSELTGMDPESVSSLADAADELSRIEPHRVQACAELLEALGGYLGVTAFQPRPIDPPEETVPDGVSGQNQLVERERLLLNRVRLRDDEGARSALEELFRFLRRIPSAGQARARSGELLVLVSRAVIEAGGAEHEVLTDAVRYGHRIQQAHRPEMACEVLAEALPALMNHLRNQATTRNYLLDQVMGFLRLNYHRLDLSLEEIARVVHLAPAYLSHLFSKELGVTMTHYLTSVRMEAAKLLLRSTELPVAKVATRVGYIDTGYFCKTFKKTQGVTPGLYRHQYDAFRATAREKCERIASETAG